MPKTADHIIEALGRTSAVAEALELTPSTVSSWRSANFIPRWWQAPLLALAVKKKVDLSTEDFPPKRPRRPSEEPERAAA
jgi:hypothetical protein